MLQILLQNLLPDKGPFKSPHQYPRQVRIIPVSDNATGPFQAGVEIERIRDTCRDVSGNFPQHRIAAFHRFGSPCQSTGCGRCGKPGCFFSEFIRDYGDYPRGN
jgi:hypothetical protein